MAGNPTPRPCVRNLLRSGVPRALVVILALLAYTTAIAPCLFVYCVPVDTCHRGASGYLSHVPLTHLTLETLIVPKYFVEWETLVNIGYGLHAKCGVAACVMLFFLKLDVLKAIFTEAQRQEKLARGFDIEHSPDLDLSTPSGLAFLGV